MQKTKYFSCFYYTILFCSAKKHIRLNYKHCFIIKLPNKRIQQIAFNHLSDIDLKDFMNFCENVLQNHILFKLLMLSFHQIILHVSERVLQKEYKIRDGKLQYDINREAAEISALSSGKIDKYKYLTVEEELPPDSRRVIEQAKCTYSTLGKFF